jgi:uncharacterized membrane protein YsdA (DUF1294 family)/cold shock CspA family protein
MRYQGKITIWKDDQGFGFITPNAGGDQVFVHLKAFSNRKWRPAGNEIVTYELADDQNGRARAENVAFVSDSSPAASLRGRGAASIAFAVLFVVFVVTSTFAGKLPAIVFFLYLGASVFAFAAYAFDKSAAQNDQWRTQESTLHMLGLIGGWPGALVAQRLLHHKTKKLSFQILFWATVTLNCGALICLLMPQSSNALPSILTKVMAGRW